MDRVNEVTQECFAALLQLRQASGDALPEPALLHTRLRSSIDGLIHKSAQHGFSQQDGQDMAYALVALVVCAWERETPASVASKAARSGRGRDFMARMMESTLADPPAEASCKTARPVL